MRRGGTPIGLVPARPYPCARSGRDLGREVGLDLREVAGQRVPGASRGLISSSGSAVAQMSSAFQQRVRNRQPLGRVDRAGHVADQPDPLLRRHAPRR